MIAKRILKRARTLHKQVFDVLYSYLNKNVRISTLKMALNKKLSRQHGVIFTQLRERSYDGIYAVGQFEYSDLPINASIEILLCYSEDLYHFTPELIHNVGVQITQTLIHELTHREQHKSQNRRRASLEQDVDYLSNKHEIDAYANDIAYGLFIDNKEYVVEKGSKIKLDECPNLYGFHQAFSFSNPELRRLTVKIYKNIEYLNSMFVKVDNKTATVTLASKETNKLR
jgi:hypothetical protein